MLAAGASTRMGFPKQLILHEGEPLVRRIAGAAVEAGADPVIVVLGANADAVSPALEDLDGVRWIVNDRWRDGLASSLAAGVREVFSDAAIDGVLVTLADQPLVNANALGKLITAFGAGRRIVASAYGGTVGVPAVFAREHADALMRLEGDAGAGSWLRSRPDEVTRIPLEAAAFDIDTSSDVAGRT